MSGMMSKAKKIAFEEAWKNARNIELPDWSDGYIVK